MSYTLVIANRNYSSWSLRPWLLMKALDIPFEERIEPFLLPSNYDAFRAFSPTGQVPVLIDGERTVWDTMGLALYLADRHEGLWPTDAAARAWAQCAVAEMHGGFHALRSECVTNIGVRVALRAPSPALERDVARLRELWEEGLARFGGPYLAGDRLTVADAFYAPVVFRIQTYGLDVGPVARTWVDQMLAHPAMRAWEEAALAEVWREAGHEAECQAAGEIMEDRRAL